MINHQETVLGNQGENSESSITNVLSFLGLSVLKKGEQVLVINEQSLKQLESTFESLSAGHLCVVFIDSNKWLSWKRCFFLRRIRCEYRVESYYALPHALNAIQLVSNNSTSLKHTLLRLYAVGRLQKMYYNMLARFFQPNVWVLSK